MLSSANIGAQFIGMLAVIKIARLLEPFGYGQFSILQAAASIAVVIGGLGLRQIIIRECARSPKQSGVIFRKAALLQLVAAIPTSFGIYIYFRHCGEIFPNVLTLLTISLFGGLLFWQLVESVAFGHEKVHFTSALMLLGNSLWAIFAWFWPPMQMTPVVACTALVLIQFAKSGAYFGLVVRERLIDRNTDPGPPIALTKYSFSFYWLALLSMATLNAPVLFLASNSAVREVGIYTAGLKLASPAYIIILALTSSMLPSISRMTIDNHNRFVSTLYAYITRGTILFIGMAFLVSVFRSEIILILFGPGYQASQVVLFMLIWFATFWLILSIIGTSLTAANRHRMLVLLSTVHAGISIPTLYVCAHYGAAALAAGMFATAIASTLYHWYFFNKSLSCVFPLSLPLSLISGMLISMALSWMISSNLSLILRLSICLCFLAVLVLFAQRRRPGKEADMTA